MADSKSGLSAQQAAAIKRLANKYNDCTSKADDPQHAAKLFKKAQADDSGRWETFHFKSLDNPFSAL